MTQDIHLFSLPVSKMKVDRIEDKQYLLDLFQVKEKLTNFFYQYPEYQLRLDECLTLFLKAFNKNQIYVDLLYFFHLHYTDLLNMEPNEKVIKRPPEIINRNTSFESGHVTNFYPFTSYFTCYSIPIVYNGIELTAKDHIITNRIKFIDTIQLHNKNLNDIKEKELAESIRIWKEFYRSEPDNDIISSKMNIFSDILDYFQLTKDREEDMLFF